MMQIKSADSEKLALFCFLYESRLLDCGICAFLFLFELLGLAIGTFHMNGVQLHREITAENRTEFIAQLLLLCLFLFGETLSLLFSCERVDPLDFCVFHGFNPFGIYFCRTDSISQTKNVW